MTSTTAVEAGSAAVHPLRPLGVVDAATRDLLLRAGLVAGVVELASLRIFTRTAIHIPALEQLHGPYEVVSTLARYAFFVSVLLLGANLAIVASERLGSVAHGRRVGGALAAAFLLVAAGARAGLLDGVALAASLSTVVAGAAVGAAASRGGLERVALALLGLAHLLAAAHGIVQDGARYGWRMDNGGGLLLAGETSALLAMVVAGAAWGRSPSRMQVVAGGGAALLVLGALVANGSTVKILLLWNFGLAGYYPSIVYAAAAAALTLAFTGARRDPDPLVLAGLVLLVVGGLGLHSTYQSGLVILGFLLLTEQRRTSLSLGNRPLDQRA
ncbi:MAG: hypothetical protein M5T61_12215 [Acidimicrobiia bacterium]|nr:hypothetical protein [Acidimicrobiia bacterium]